MQGYTKLLSALGSNVVEFLSNLNALHLHLTTGFPAMSAPAFRCDKVCAAGGIQRMCHACNKVSAGDPWRHKGCLTQVSHKVAHSHFVCWSPNLTHMQSSRPAACYYLRISHFVPPTPPAAAART